MRDQGCEVSTVSTVLEFSSPFATLLIRYVDRSSNYSIYRNTADLPIYQSNVMLYLYISTFRITQGIYSTVSYLTRSSQAIPAQTYL
jgi:hypothetical protein